MSNNPNTLTSSTTESDTPWAQIAQLIQSLGHKHFAEECLKTLNHFAKTDHFALFIFDESLKPKLVAGASPPEKDIVIDTSKEYSRHYYMSDPNVTYISKHMGESESPLMLHLTIDEITDKKYRKQIYEEKGLIERISWIGIAGTIWYSGNIYRDDKSGYFSKEEIEEFRQKQTFICANLEQHIERLSPSIKFSGQQTSPEFYKELVSELPANLSEREIAVCARALRGMTRTGIALDLGIKPTTVATLTQRAHSKLNISSLNELFALCLQVLTMRDNNKNLEQAYK